MSSEKPSHLRSRRDFIRQASCAAVGTMALTSTIRDLRLINSVLAQTSLPGYKALVCVFLGGGNDSNNWIVPTDTETYDQYAAIRGNLGLPKSSLLPLYQNGTSGALYADTDGHNYGLHPSCGELQTLFGEDKIAFVMNVGTLVRPTTRQNYLTNPRFYTPPQLFSHSDQVTQWQTSIPDQPPITGWGGRVADLLDPVANPSANISMSISLNGANTFEVGNLVSQYHVSTSGAVMLSGDLLNTSVSGARGQAFKDIMNLTNPNLQRSAYAGVARNAIAVGEALNTNIAPTALDSFWNPNPFPNTNLGRQLRMVARLIEAANDFAVTRQIFFCSVGGYDTHTSQVLFNGVNDATNPNGAHFMLLNEVSEALFAFQRAMEKLDGLDPNKPFSKGVTTFTASDFSRTFPTNSQGSDHGWGSHHLIMGGAVDGGKVFGHLPTFAINGPDDTGLGRWIPTLAVDQYSSTLAKWFGVDVSKLADVFPNLSRFPTNDLGFML